jgi:TrpR family trp operon transcriptional repressor
MRGTDGWPKFINLCDASIKANNFAELMEFFLTPEEKEQLALRVLLVQELLSGEKTQRQIAKDLTISISKITRGSNHLKVAEHQALKAFLQEQLK